MQTHVTIVVVGDAGAGKSSLISSVVQEDFPEKVPPKLPPVWLASNEDNARTELIDTSTKVIDARKVEADLRRADFICIVYDVSKQDTKAAQQAIEKNWITKIKQIKGERFQTHLALLGTKMDLCPSQDLSPEEKSLAKKKRDDEWKPFLDKHEQIEWVLECSAKDPDSVAEIDTLFWHIQQYVLYPKGPLCDSNHIFSPEFSGALSHIYSTIVGDRGILDDVGLGRIQVLCGDEQLGEEQVLKIKEAIEAQPPFEDQFYKDQPRLTESNQITKAGFFVLFRLLVEQNIEAVWRILRFYRYNNQLVICPEEKKPEPTLPTQIRKSPIPPYLRVFGMLSVAGFGCFLLARFNIIDKKWFGFLSSGWDALFGRPKIDFSGTKFQK